jgi:hypothetical protein
MWRLKKKTLVCASQSLCLLFYIVHKDLLMFEINMFFKLYCFFLLKYFYLRDDHSFFKGWFLHYFFRIHKVCFFIFYHNFPLSLNLTLFSHCQLKESNIKDFFVREGIYLDLNNYYGMSEELALESSVMNRNTFSYIASKTKI